VPDVPRHVAVGAHRPRTSRRTATTRPMPASTTRCSTAISKGARGPAITPVADIALPKPRSASRPPSGASPPPASSTDRTPEESGADNDVTHFSRRSEGNSEGAVSRSGEDLPPLKTGTSTHRRRRTEERFDRFFEITRRGPRPPRSAAAS
jgi:hypothetical protein